MKCPECQAGVSDSAKFCGKCGTKLLRICSSCGSENPLGNNFCEACGQNMTQPHGPAPTELSFDEKLDKIQRYLPRGLTEKILSQRDKIEGERKQVTVMFCDLAGFTPLVEKLGAEEAYAIMDQVYEILIHKVHDYEGTVNEMTGDGIMALFGAPIALEDAPQRAIRSALAIHREMTRFNDKLKEERKGLPSLKMRIGIHSGPVVVGTLGNNLRVEFKAVGDTVNLASRMEGLAEPGTTYVTEDTFKLTEGLFRFESLGERSVKGKESPLRVYQVIAPTTRRTRFDVSAERGLTSFVGRDRELELLLDGLARAKEGSGQAFSIIGEAGIGKSRFLYEFHKAVSSENITFLEGKCLSYGRGVPYHPIIDVLKGNFDIGEGDSDERIRNKVERSLEILKTEKAATLPYLLELLGVKDPGIDRIRMSREGVKERIVQAVKEIILKGARVRPLVIAIEDLHWADRSTEDALKWLLEAVPGTSVLIIFTYRPEFVHTWGGRSYHNQITLNRLSNRESLTMVSHLLGTDGVDPELQKLILDKTEGVPFFIEEFVKSLQGLALIKREGNRVLLKGDPLSVSIPSTVQDMIMARVDRLSDGARAVLQAGSVIEREFPGDLIRAVTGLPEPELLTHLSALKDAELLYERGVYPQTSYIFRHALTREVVYGSMLERRRRELHGRVGAAIEDKRREDLAERYEILSEHYSRAEDYRKAAEYAKRASRKAEKSGSLPDAIAHAQKRVLCLESLPDSAETARERIDARTVLGLYLAQITHPLEAREAVEPVAGLALDMGYRKRVCQIQTVMGTYYYMFEEDLPKAADAYEEALDIAEEEGDLLTMALGSLWLGCIRGYACDFEKARLLMQKAVDINLAAKSLWGIASVKAQLAWVCDFMPGRISEFMEVSSEALAIAQESGDLFSMGYSYTVYGMACYAKGDFENAEKNSLDGKLFCDRGGNHTWGFSACATLAQMYFMMNEYQKSKEWFEKGRVILQEAQIFPSWVRWVQLGVAMCEVMLGDRDVNLEVLRVIPEKDRLKALQGFDCRFLGEIFMNLGAGHMAEAEHWIRKAIEEDGRNGIRLHLGLNHAVYGELFKRQGDRTKAQEQFGKAVDTLRECGADGWVEKYERELAVLR